MPISDKCGEDSGRCAGPAIEYVHSVRPLREIIGQLTQEYEAARSQG